MEEWCAKHGLSEEVVKILKEEAFDTLEALQCMDTEDLDALPLKRGHKAVLRKSLLELNEKSSFTTIRSNEHPCRESERKISELFSGFKISDGATTSKGENYLKITDFIPQGIIVEEEMSIGGGVVLKLPGARAKLEKVSPSAWIAGNAKIMMALLARQENFKISDYIKYTEMIGELGCRFTWQSVLVFDDEYRQRQHKEGFRWGSEAPHLATVVLRDRPLASSRITQRQRAIPSTKKDICLQFNRGVCSYGLRCIYQHVCSSCGKDHPFVLHASSASSTPPTGYSA